MVQQDSFVARRCCAVMIFPSSANRAPLQGSEPFAHRNAPCSARKERVSCTICLSSQSMSQTTLRGEHRRLAQASPGEPLADSLWPGI